MKRILTILLSTILLFSSLFMSACAKKQIEIKYADAPSIMQLLIDDQIEFGLLPEPAISTLEKVKGKDIAWQRLSLQDLYDKDEKSYPQAVLMAKNDVLENHPQIINKIKEKFSDNLTWTESNPEKAIGAIKSIYDKSTLNAKIIDSAVIKNCKISWQDALDGKDAVNKYLDGIMDIAIGLDISPAKKVEDKFFYSGSSENGQDASGKTFSFYVPDGAPALAIAKFIEEKQAFESGATFSYNVVDAANIAKYMSGALDNVFADFIILPVNAASKMYDNPKAQYTCISIVTHGNLYIVRKAVENSEFSIKDLKDKKIGVIGEGNVPDLTLKAILKDNNFSFSKIA